MMTITLRPIYPGEPFVDVEVPFPSALLDRVRRLCPPDLTIEEFLAEILEQEILTKMFES